MAITSERALTITLVCDRPGCDGTVRFEGPVVVAGHPPRLLGHCGRCRGAFTLFGGRMEPYEPEPPTTEGDG